MESIIPQPKPPPAFAPRSPEPLRGRGGTPAPPFPPGQTAPQGRRKV